VKSSNLGLTEFYTKLGFVELSREESSQITFLGRVF
jgi:hypothetical protein